MGEPGEHRAKAIRMTHLLGVGALGTVFPQSCLERRMRSQKPSGGNTEGQREASGEGAAACGWFPQSFAVGGGCLRGQSAGLSKADFVE